LDHPLLRLAQEVRLHQPPAPDRQTATQHLWATVCPQPRPP